jgi:hypothetical protein
MAQEDPEPDERGRLVVVDRARLVVVDARLVVVDRARLVLVDRDAAGFLVVDFLVAGFFAAVDRDLVAADFDAAGREAVVVPRAALGRSRLATRRASVSTSARSFPISSNTPCCSSDSRTFVTARATSSTIWLPRSFEPSGNARSTALRTASTVSAAPEPLLSFFFFPSFLAMARV